MDLLQWTACLVALAGAYLVGARTPTHRRWGFVLFLASNLLWIWWGSLSSAWALVTMQALFCLTSIRGISHNRQE